MNIPKKPKNMKDPVLIMGKWEERVPPCPRAGTTMIDVKAKDCDPEDKVGKAGIPFKPASKKK